MSRSRLKAFSAPKLLMMLRTYSRNEVMEAVERDCTVDLRVSTRERADWTGLVPKWECNGSSLMSGIKYQSVSSIGVSNHELDMR